MHVFIDRENKELDSDYSGKAGGLLKQLGINVETVVITKNGQLITEDDQIGGDDKIKIISVVSGG